MPSDQFFRHHGKAYDCNKITWYDEMYNGRRMNDCDGAMRFPETRRWSMINTAWKPEHSDYPLQGASVESTSWEPLKAEFHYASWFEPASNQIA